jgi:hypothetical protein
MKASTSKRLEAIEAALAVGPRVHWIWDDGEGADIEAEIAARIAAGVAKAGDAFHIVSWRPPDPRFPNGPLGGYLAGEADR